MRRQSSDLLIVAILAIVCALSVLLLASVPLLRVLGALPLVLFLPGYAITACLPQRALERVARLLVTLGLSIALTILLGLALYGVGIKLQSMAWASALAVITLIACGLAARLKPAAKVEEPAARLSLHFDWRNVALLGVAVVIGGLAMGIARLPAPASGVSGYTTLWMIPARDGSAGKYEMGITNYEFDTVTYHLQLMADGHPLQDWPELKLAPGETWTSSIVLPSDRTTTGSIEAMLYRLDNPNVIYRQVKLSRTQ